VAAPSVRTAEPKLTDADVHQLISKAGANHNLDVDLLASVVRAESGGNIHAVSRTGAQGLMQLMPGTAAELGVADSFRADQNINGGTAYLDELLVKYHDNLALALAAYNAGPAAVDKYHGVPPYRETRIYVARVIREFNRRKLLEKAELRTNRPDTAGTKQ
jgi:soluble lytic murein transglycosylase-like protein